MNGLLAVVLLVTMQTMPDASPAQPSGTSACAYFSSAETGRIAVSEFFTNTADATGDVTHVTLGLKSITDEHIFVHLANKRRTISHGILWEVPGTRYFVMSQTTVAGYTHATHVLSHFPSAPSLVRLAPKAWQPIDHQYAGSRSDCRS